MDEEVVKADSAKNTQEPAAKPVSKPIAKPAAKPAVKPVAKPVVKPVVKPVSKPIAKPVITPAAKPVSNSAVKSPDKKSAKKAAKVKAPKIKAPKAEVLKVKKPKREKIDYELRIDLLGKAIKKARKDRKLTQKELGQLVGVKKAQISKLENSLTDARFETIIKVFKALNVKVNFSVQLLDQIVSLK